MTSAIETVGLTRRFGRAEAVADLTVSVPARSIFALIGPNGAGKTTTIKLLMNLLRPQHGVARVLGTDARRLGVRELQRIGYVSENQRLPDWMTTRQLCEYVRPFYPTWNDALARDLERTLGLGATAPVRSLSRGTRMKVALLAALAYRPELIVLDEPFTGLDPLVRDQLVRALRDAAADAPRTILIASHDIEEVERLADWIGFIVEGRLLFAEPVAALLARFRLIEVVGGAAARLAHPAPTWIMQEKSGPTLRFIDTAYDEVEAPARIAAVFPGAEVRALPMPLRDIFVALAARGAGRSGT